MPADTLPAMEGLLEGADLDRWARTGRDLGRRGREGAEAAAEWYRAGPALAAHLDPAGLRRVGDLAASLADLSPRVAAAFVRSAPAVAGQMEAAAVLEAIEAWVAAGRRLCRGTRRTAALAARWFDCGPALLPHLAPDDLARLAEVLDRLAAAATDLAADALDHLPATVSGLTAGERPAFVGLARALAAAATPDALLLLERGPEMIAAVAPDARGAFLEVATRSVRADRVGFVALAEAAAALRTVPAAEHAGLLAFAARLAEGAPRAALECLGSAAEVHERVGVDGFVRWAEVGATLVVEDHHPSAAEAYFRLESTLATETLTALSVRVDFAAVSNLLARYVQALAGERVTVHTTESLVARRLGWTSGSVATTDGRAIHLPACIDRFDDPAANFRVYKVAATHQAGRLEFGSFRFRFGAPAEHRRSTLADRERRAGGPRKRDAGLPEIGIRRFFDLFDDRRLAADLFALVEDTRVAARVAEEYPGIRSALREVQSHEATRRPDPRRLALRQALVENLMRISLGRPDTIQWPARIVGTLSRATDLLDVVRQPGASVQDSAEVAAALYDLATTVPNVPPGRIEIVSTDGAPVEVAELPYEGLPPPEFRGDFKPGLVELLDTLAEHGAALTEGDLAGLAELLGDDPDLDQSGSDAEALARRLAEEAAERRPDDADDATPGEEADDERIDIEWTWYDEWDFRAADYRGRWCRVGERPADDGDPDFYVSTLRRHHGLVVETRRQFELLRPESFRRIRRLEDGHEIDLDQAVEFHADRKAGAGPLARFYSRRDKQERNVAVAFLLDISGSTDDPVEPSAGGGRGQSQRVIDLEKEAAVIATEAVEAIGDAYAIFGFSGYGRSHVEFHVVKDFDDPLDDRARGRLGKVEPRRSTRMGAAIRHATAKLKAREARVRLLMLLSDGRPQDHNYGRDRDDHDYAVHDTKQALLEARRAGIVPFLVTVDATGHDYLREMCGDLGYEVVADLESLPRRLPALYRYLATG